MSVPEITVKLPPLYFPMPLRCHPKVALLEQRGLDWMDRFGFCRTPARRARVAGTKTAHFFAYLCPDADPDLLQAAVDWGYLMFVFDDRHCDEESSDDGFSFLDLSVRIVRTLEAPDAAVLDPQHPFTAPVLDLAWRVHRTVSPTLVRRLADSHRSWYHGAAWDLAARSRALVPNLNDYIFTRMLYVASFTTLTWFQLSEPDTIADEDLFAPAVQSLTEMAGTVAAIDDDLYSYGKELWFTRRSSAPTFPGNMINVCQRQYGHTQAQALAATAALRDRIVDRFVEVRDRIQPTAGSPLRRYLSNLTCLIRGNYEWGLAAERYSDPDGQHPGAVQTIGALADAPHATGAPADAPGIAWWWAV
ncbi:glutamate dehydrogenase [Streptomyces sp. NPDC021100]|uniref:terpene synthase family protein n=1 Tax=Streptomyces sp. NPDC021100 TaxID=3365114 RepID=UPI00378C64AB